MPVEAKEFTIARLDVKPGDTLVAKYNGILDTQARAKFNEQLRGVFPEGVKVIVVDRDVDFTVISAEASRAVDVGALEGKAALSPALGES